ncbi:MAG: SDR family NAD(P)-dependent oxidoreductase [Opitutales bacterium]
MDIAVVTGASSGLGIAISRTLLNLGFRVYGLGGNYNDSPLQNVEFRPIPCDLGDGGMVEHHARALVEKEGAVSLLVNNAKLYPGESMDDAAGGQFALSLNVNLLCPLILTRVFLPGLQRVQGRVITISPATPETSRGGPAGAAAAGGLRWMHEILFQQYRDRGVSFSIVSPEPNRWRPADSPPPKGEHPQSAIDPQAVAEAVGGIAQSPYGNVATEIVIRPKRLSESAIPPMREVPYPKPKPIPYTVPRELIEAEEQLEREEDERSFRKRELRRADVLAAQAAPASEPEPELEPAREREREMDEDKDERPAPTRSRADRRPEPEERETDDDRPKKRRRRRRRGKGDRGPDFAEDERPARRDQPREDTPRPDKPRPERRDEPAAEKQSAPAPREERATEAMDRPAPESKDAAPAAEPSRKRRRGRKPRPMPREEKPGFLEPALAPAPGRERPPAPTPTPTPVKGPSPDDRPAAAASADTAAPAAKKATTKKAATKKAAKKATAKKAAKKATKKAATKKVARKAVKKAPVEPPEDTP